MAAEILANAGAKVSVYERKPSVGRKFLMAGRGGLNLTHSENIDLFMKRYGAAEYLLSGPISNFSPDDLRRWADGLGQKTFVGSSGRVFPESFKASPLLRAWLSRLNELGVVIHTGHEWCGWDENDHIVFQQAGGNTISVPADAVLLALGGASWPRLGSDGGWVEILKTKSVSISPLRPTNCGFIVQWSDVFKNRYPGQPVKPLVLSCAGKSVKGEMMITGKGVEGGGIYALSAVLRDEIERNGHAALTLDLQPDISLEDLATRLQKPRKGKSFSNFLQSVAGLSGIATALLMEAPDRKELSQLSALALAKRIKELKLDLPASFDIDRAISTAGGIRFESVDGHFMLKNMPGVFVAGEMLDWEAPTGGYLLQATFSTAVTAAQGILLWLQQRQSG